MKSTVQSFGHVIDCRIIAFEGSFFHFTKEEAVQFAHSFYDFVQILFAEECVLQWRVNGKSFKYDKNPWNKLSSHDDRSNRICLELKGDIVNERVYNITTLSKYSQDLKYRLALYADTPSVWSIDYTDYAAKEITPFSSSLEMLREAIIKTFSLEGCINRNCYSHHDIEAIFYASSDYIQKEQYSGTVQLWISMYSMQGNVGDISEALYQYAMLAAIKFQDLNVTIKIKQVQHERCSFYFNRLIMPRNVKLDSNIDRNAHHRYLNDVGWTTILSPYTAKKRNQGKKNVLKDQSTYKTVQMENGGECIKNNRSMEETTIQDLKNIKNEVYDVCFPGEARYQPDYHWRGYWENIPVFDYEILTDSNQVIFRIRNEADLYFILG